MTESTTEQQISAFLAEKAAVLASHPFLLAIREGLLSKAQLLDFGLQYYISSRNFATFLCAVAANIPSVELRFPLISNLYDEHGNGRIDRAHIRLFRRFLLALGADAESIATARPFPAIEQYNVTFLAYCKTQPYLDALGTIAAIEYVTPFQYRAILWGCEAHYNISIDDLEFFRLHIHEDDSHARDIINSVIPLLDSPTSKGEFFAGMEFCVSAEEGFWSGLQATILSLQGG